MIALTERTKEVPVPDEILAAMRDLVRSSRPEDPSCPDRLRDLIWYGASPRAGIAMVSCARALALLSGEDTVRWKHVRRVARPTLRHRVRLTARARRDRVDADHVVGELLANLEARSTNLLQGIES